ncbi:MAG: hypothetical protein M5U01_02760 [Ardenticatenaceae bacterium]|nr:hypothetical protein [Ardenticatenaceae bacterium]
MNRIPIFLFGLGPIGRQIGRLASERDDLRLVGGVDINPDLEGRDLGRVLGLEAALGIPVVRDLAALEAPAGAVALHATGSALARVTGQFSALLSGGFNVVSTCEELAYPFFHQPARARELDALARAHDVTLVGTGINPGFAMDTLPLVLTAVSRRVDSVRVERRVAAGLRREPLQRKIGAGLSREAFEAGVAAGTIRHVGLPESVAAIAAGLRWSLDRIAEQIEPVIAAERISTAYLTVEPGQVAGVHQVARGWEQARERVVLELTMAVSVPTAVDRTTISGDPDLTMTLEGIHGDTATAAIVLNAVAPVVVARPGLLTMTDLTLVHR